MTFKEGYLNFLQEKITDILKANNNDDINVAVHDEFYYEKTAQADITLKFLPGQIQAGIPQYPAEIYIQVEEQYKDDILNAFNDFIEYYNETVETFAGENYKQFYTLPSILSAFQDGTTRRIVTAQISLSLFSFKNMCGITSVVIDNETIGFVNFAMAYTADTNSTGGLNSIETKSKAEKVTRTLTLTFVPIYHINDEATKQILNYLLDSDEVTTNLVTTPRDYNHTFSITINRQFGVAKTWTTNWIIKDCSYAQEINGFPTVQVTFIRRA